MPTMKDAEAFTQLLREKFSDKGFAKYSRFLYDFVNLRIDFQVFLDGVMGLMNGHPALIPEFNKFLPKGYASASKQYVFFSSATKSGDFPHKCNQDDALTTVADDEPFRGKEIQSRNCESGAKKCDFDPQCLPDTHYLYQFQKIGEKKKILWGTNDYKIREEAIYEFLSRVKQRVGDGVYKRFLQLFSGLKVKAHGDIDGRNKDVLELLKDHPELQTDFSVLNTCKNQGFMKRFEFGGLDDLVGEEEEAATSLHKSSDDKRDIHESSKTNPEITEEAKKWRHRFLIKRSYDKGPDNEPIFKKPKKSSPESDIVAGVATESSPGECRMKNDNFVNTELELWTPASRICGQNYVNTDLELSIKMPPLVMFEVAGLLEYLTEVMDLSLRETSAEIQSTSEGEEFKSETLDRISNLPDAILIYMLSFLPTKFAAQTEILSKRWQDLWVEVPTLDFDMHLRANFKGEESTFDALAKTQMESFQNFVNRLLARRGNLSLRRFRLACDGIEPECLLSWMSSIHGLEELDLEICRLGESPLSTFHFTSEPLRVLKLFGHFCLNIPSTLSFPRLETLHLSIADYIDDLSIRKLLSNCPVLENLKIERSEWDNIRNFVISAPSLKRLDLVFQIHEMYLYDSETDEEFECSLFVDAPNVEYLRLLDYMSKSVEVNPMPYVTEANISVSKIAECDDRTREEIRNYGNNVCALFHSIANVKHLTVRSFTLEALSDAFDRRMPIFLNLVHLEVDFETVNGAMLLPSLLEVSPMLETLILPQGITNPAEQDQGFSYEENRRFSYLWIPPKQVPHCLLYTLKVVEIRQVTGEVEEELKLLKYFLQNAMVLERMTILCHEFIISGGPLDNVKERTSAARALVDRFPFRHDLMNYVRGSSVCQLDIHIPEPTILNWA
ncbi:OLC1v1022806C1 [Oldenlandia corymbosa var. corymbosa]|uniref:OLC1v1022806C1 n=1 Tax=Oldenlandia corymbosa var. corymbosa TaxID=529605 RepID=A0AAV1C2A6_OLDCO|nr:OLC1v1022806C1 [Oldenlandia corymbosa var. corymbosa]